MNRDLAVFWLGAALVIAGVALWLWWTRPAGDTLPETYEYGVM